jgi:hypothetical protein
MIKKKWLVIFSVWSILFLFISLILLSITYISAQPYSAGGGYGGSFNIRQGSEQLINFFIDWGEPFIQAFFGGYDYTGYLLFEKFLVFILLAAVVFLSLKRTTYFEKNRIVIWIIAIIVPLLAVRYMQFGWINTILLSYTVVGVALAGILPFIIYLFFLHGVFSEGSSVPRKIGWIFFIVVYFGLWSTAQTENYGEIYFWTMVVSFFFLLFDGTIHRALMKQKWNEAERSIAVAAISELEGELRRIQKSKLIPDDRRRLEEARIRRRIDSLRKRAF